MAVLNTVVTPVEIREATPEATLVVIRVVMEEGMEAETEVEMEEVVVTDCDLNFTYRSGCPNTPSFPSEL